MNMNPIFIGGCDRSGTTFLGSLLGTHQQSLCVPESQFIIEVLNGSNFKIDDIEPRAVLEMIRKHPRFKIWAIDVDDLAVDQSINSYSSLIEHIVKHYGEKNAQPTPHFWVDHTPSNIKYVATLLEIFPNAKMIHLVRDGRAVASSLLPLIWGPRSVDKAAYFWLTNLAYGLAAEALYGSNRIMRVKYEELVNETESTLQAICSFIGMEYQPNMVQGDGFKVPSFTRKQHALVGKKPNQTRVNAWQKKLTPRQIEIFESTTANMLNYLGYTPRFGMSAKGMTPMERIISTLKQFLMFAGNIRNEIILRQSTNN